VTAIPSANATGAFVVDTAHPLRYAPSTDQPDCVPAIQGVIRGLEARCRFCSVLLGSPRAGLRHRS
jgi:hypothetical protein